MRSTLIKTFWIFLVIHCTNHFGLSQSESNMPSEPGKCYAKCLIQDKYEHLVDQQFFFENIDIYFDGVDGISLSSDVIGWEKLMDPNCSNEQVKNSNCFIWKPVRIKADSLFIIDESIFENLDQIIYRANTLVRPGGYTEWREVLCEKDITSDIIWQLEYSLSAKKYYTQTRSGLYGAHLKAALVRYQQENGHPVGSMDLETLKSLNIEF